MGKPVVIRRQFSGVRVDGLGLGVTLMPGAHGQISVTISAFPTITPYDCVCSLHNEGSVTDFAPSCIHIVGNTLQCLQNSNTVLAFREGFILDLEPGMKEFIQDVYPKLVHIAELSARVFLRVDTLMKERGIAHMADFIPNVVAKIVLDGQDVEQALASAACEHFAGKDEAFMQSFEDTEVRAIFDDAALTKQRSLA